MIAVIAKIPVIPEKKDEALEVIRNLMKDVAGEKGTLFYSVNVDQKNPDTLVFIERYKDMDAVSAHSSTPHFKDFMGKVAGFAAGKPEITLYEEIESV
jgi:quinol monooxygenase YgiN